MDVAHDDGTVLELGPGNAYEIMPGNDAWIVGDERCIAFEFESRRRRGTRPRPLPMLAEMLRMTRRAVLRGLAAAVVIGVALPAGVPAEQASLDADFTAAPPQAP